MTATDLDLGKYKLGWSDARNSFVHEKTGEDLIAVMKRVISQQLGAPVQL